MSDKIDLYSDRGVLLKSDVDLSAVSPLKNAAMQRLISLTKRTVAVNLAGIEGALKTGKVAGGRRQIKGRELNYDVVANAGALADKIKTLLQVAPGDDTNVKVLGGGKQLLVQIPTMRVNAASEFVVGLTGAAAATTEALIQQFKATMVEAPMIHASVWGEYPQTVGMSGGNVASVLNIPQNDEGLGFALRNVMANHLAMITKRNAMNAAALASIYEQIGEFEMGNAMGIFERHQLLGMAYQGLNANNMVYECVKANGKTGTIGTVVQSTVAKALEDKVIKAGKKLPSGYVTVRGQRCIQVERLLRRWRTGSHNGQLRLPEGRSGCVLDTAVLQRYHREGDRPARMRLRKGHGNGSRILVLQPLHLRRRRPRCIQRQPRGNQALQRICHTMRGCSSSTGCRYPDVHT